MKPVILLVDDNQDILEFVSDFMDEKYTTIKALNGQEALDILRYQSVQLVITDIMMPNMDGYELCEKIKSNFEYSHIPVILLTAKNTFQSKIDGLEIGADAYIEKPFSPRHLQLQVSNLLISRNKIKEYLANSPLLHIKGMAHTKGDANFLAQLNDAVMQNIKNTNLDVVQIAKIMNISRPTLYRKIKEISNTTPNEIINITRLKKAAELLAEDVYSINQISEMVGFTSQTVFGRTFQKQFGMTPSRFVGTRLRDRQKFN
jgi:two-component system cell cycle response regulator